MEPEPLHPFGAALATFDAGSCDREAAAWIVGCVARHRVLVLRGQAFDPPGFAAFLRRLGPLTFTEGETAVASAPDLNVVTNVGRTRPPRSVFHTDTSYVERPPAVSALDALEVPEAGGETLFSDQVRAFRSLDAATRTRIAGRTVRHAYERPDGVVEEHRQPLVLIHPLTGERSLYLSALARCSAVSGLNDAQSQDLLEYLYRHSTDPAHLYRHAWRPGEVVLWDNRVTMHRADHSAVIGNRTLHRGLLAGTPLTSAPPAESVSI